MKILKNVLITIVLAGIAGCATTPPPPPLPPAIDSEQRSIIGISLEVRAPIKAFSNNPDAVYFVKIDEEADLFTKGNFILSNYYRDGQAYLLNAKPGRYVAVACYRKVSPLGQKSSNYTTFFSKELIKLTDVTVNPGEVAFMGEYVIDSSAGLNEADSAQLQYAQIIAPGKSTSISGSIFSAMFGGEQDAFYKGSLHVVASDKQVEIKFLTNAIEHFKDSAWISFFQKRLDNL